MSVGTRHVALFMWVTLLASTVQAEAAAEPRAAQVTPDAAKALANLHFPHDREVPFRQRQLNPLLKRTSEQQGVLSISNERGLVMRVTAPRAEERTIADGVITLTRARMNPRAPGPKVLTRRMQLNPAQPGHLVLLAMEALLLGDVELLQQHFELQTITTEQGWGIGLIPSDSAVRGQLSRLLLFGSAERLTRFRSERDDANAQVSAWLEIEIGAEPAAEHREAS